MRRRIAMLVVLVVLLGCVAERYRYAAVHTTSAQAGESSAVVRIPSGDVRLATSGITSLRPNGVEGSTLRAIHVAIVVSNRSDETWIVDGADQQLELAAGRARSSLSAMTEDAKEPSRIEVPAASTRRIDLFFVLPSGLSEARDVATFDLIWTVRTPSRSVTERTPFQRFLIGPPRPPEELPGSDVPTPRNAPLNPPPVQLPVP